jgi:hypothetical protein
MLEGDERLCFVRNRKLNAEQQQLLKELHNAGATTSAITHAINNVSNSKKKT